MMAKRLFDIVISALLLVVLALPLLILWVLTRLFMGSPAIHRSKRPGFGGELFTMYKFRTMTDEVDEAGVPLPDAERMTQFGRLMRSLSLDELPELWNVLKGDMSLVGPRPLLPEYLDRYDDYQARRHEVRPGITGLAQVRGRNAVDWEQRLDLDVWYVDHRSLGMDLRILVATLWRVLARTGISAEDHATMPEFRGIDDG